MPKKSQKALTPENIAKEIVKVYEDAGGKFVPPKVARAIALSKLTGKKTK